MILLYLIGYASYDAGKYSPRMLKFNDVEEVIERIFLPSCKLSQKDFAVVESTVSTLPKPVRIILFEEELNFILVILLVGNGC